jgi:hypothetical protein
VRFRRAQGAEWELAAGVEAHSFATLAVERVGQQIDEPPTRVGLGGGGFGFADGACGRRDTGETTVTADG